MLWQNQIKLKIEIKPFKIKLIIKINKMEAVELRKKTNELENQIKILVDQFIKNVGVCDVKINTDFHFMEKKAFGEKILISTGIKVNIII